MIWRTSYPLEGHRRWLRKFAWIPARLAEDQGIRTWIWLRRYSVLQEFGWHPGEWGNNQFGWYEISRRLP